MKIDIIRIEKSQFSEKCLIELKIVNERSSFHATDILNKYDIENLINQFQNAIDKIQNYKKHINAQTK